MKTFILLTLLIITTMFIPVNVLAQDVLSEPCAYGGGGSSACQASSENPLYGPNGVITRATQLVAIVVGVAAVIMIIIGGFRYVISSGDPNSIEGAKNTILFAVIGLVIAAVAQTIVLFVLRKL